MLRIVRLGEVDRIVIEIDQMAKFEPSGVNLGEESGRRPVTLAEPPRCAQAHAAGWSPPAMQRGIVTPARVKPKIRYCREFPGWFTGLGTVAQSGGM